MFAGPVALLLAATLIVVGLRAVLHDDGGSPTPTTQTHAKKTKATPARQTARLYTVRAGDTFASISAATGVTVAKLQQLNPKVEPTSLFIGDRIRLR